MTQGDAPHTRSDAEQSDETARGAMRAIPSFEEIYARFGERVLNLAYRFTRDEESARDMTQEVFTKVYENLGAFREESGLYTWIHRIAVNHILNHLKKERRHRWLSLMDERVGDLLNDERVVEPAFHHRVTPPGPDRILEAAERDQVVRTAVASLPVKYRVPFELFRFEEMSYQEIADAMGLSLSAVEARIHRAKKQLLSKLEPWLDSIS
jgi:RNA polymerase sigma-70 factor (ECF subfamily)